MIELSPNKSTTVKSGSGGSLQTMEVVHVPENCVAIISPRVTMGNKLLLLTSQLIEGPYSGELTINLYNAGTMDIELRRGIKIINMAIAHSAAVSDTNAVDAINVIVPSGLDDEQRTAVLVAMDRLSSAAMIDVKVGGDMNLTFEGSVK